MADILDCPCGGTGEMALPESDEVIACPWCEIRRLKHLRKGDRTRINRLKARVERLEDLLSDTTRERVRDALVHGKSPLGFGRKVTT